MITETGSVVAVDSDGIWVETLNTTACGSCHAKTGCGQKLLAGYGASNTKIKAYFAECARDEIWKVGDSVEIGIEETALVSGALLVYLLPLCMMIFFIYFFAQIFTQEGVVALGGLFGLVLGGKLCAYLIFENTSKSVNALDDRTLYDSKKFQAMVIGRG